MSKYDPDPKDKKEKIIYPKGDDEIADISNQLDFSQGFKNRKIAEALCHDNPQEDRRLKYRLDILNRQKRQKSNAFRNKQRTFFIEQLFEKGLNPFLGQTSEDAEDNDSYGDSYGLNQGSKTDRPEIYTNPHNTVNLDNGYVTFGLARSHTIGDMRTSHSANTQHALVHSLDSSKKTTEKTYNKAGNAKYNISLHPIREHSSFETTSQFPVGLQNRTLDKKFPVNSEREALCNIKISRSPNRRDITTLRKNPGMLFPKLRGLLKGEISQTVYNSRTTTFQDNVNHDISTRKSTLKPVLPAVQKTMYPEQSPDEYQTDTMKTIRQLSTDLPEHFKISARDQIRKMTNSDKIYRRKEELKAENRPLLEREHSFGDRRWHDLENSLSSNVNNTLEWKQLRRAGPWVLQNNKSGSFY